MCRSIKTLRPPFIETESATDEEIHAAALQFVRKISGFNKPSRVNEAAFNTAVESVFRDAWALLHSLQTSATPKNREVEAAKARARAQKRFGRAARAAT